MKRPLDLVEFPDPEPGTDVDIDLIRKLIKKLEEQDEKENRFKHQAMVLVSDKTKAKKLAEKFNSEVPNSASAIVGGSKDYKIQQAIKNFSNGEFRVAVVCRMLLEGFDNPSVSICAIHRRLSSRPLFEQFIGRCLRRKRFQNANELDRTRAVVLSYKQFKQEEHFQAQEGVDSKNIVPEDFITNDEDDANGNDDDAAMEIDG